MLHRHLYFMILALLASTVNARSEPAVERYCWLEFYTSSEELCPPPSLKYLSEACPEQTIMKNSLLACHGNMTLFGNSGNSLASSFLEEDYEYFPICENDFVGKDISIQASYMNFTMQERVCFEKFMSNLIYCLMNLPAVQEDCRQEANTNLIPIITLSVVGAILLPGFCWYIYVVFHMYKDLKQEQSINHGTQRQMTREMSTTRVRVAAPCEDREHTIDLNNIDLVSLANDNSVEQLTREQRQVSDQENSGCDYRTPCATLP